MGLLSKYMKLNFLKIYLKLTSAAKMTPGPNTYCKYALFGDLTAET